jgi:hypothetical protein
MQSVTSFLFSDVSRFHQLQPLTTMTADPQHAQFSSSVFMNSRKRNIFSSSIAPTGAPPAEFSNPEKSRMRHVNNRRFVAADDNSADDSASPFAMFPPAATRKRGVALDENVLAPTPTPPSRAANNDDDDIYLFAPIRQATPSFRARGRRRPRRATMPSSTSLDEDADDENNPVINGDALAAAHHQ